MVRTLFAENEFFEVFVDTPINICEERDPKGLYKKARRGEIKNFTGIDSAYEPPLSPELHLHTDTQSVDEMATQITDFYIARLHPNS
jgi:adenylylsulfate kinase-like enzyme